MKRKQWLSLTLALCFALSLFPTALAAPAKSTQKTLKLSKSSITLTVGQTKTVTANQSAVKWKSQNSKVASVKAGKITAKSAGKTTVSITKSGKKANLKITVKAKKSKAAVTDDDVGTGTKKKNAPTIVPVVNAIATACPSADCTPAPCEPVTCEPVATCPSANGDNLAFCAQFIETMSSTGFEGAKIVVLSSVAERDAYLATLVPPYNFDQPYVDPFQTTFDAYDDCYFERNVLVVVPFTDGQIGYGHEVTSVGRIDGKVVVNIDSIVPDHGLPDAINHVRALVELSKADVGNAEITANVNRRYLRPTEQPSSPQPTDIRPVKPTDVPTADPSYVPQAPIPATAQTIGVRSPYGQSKEPFWVADTAAFAAYRQNLKDNNKNLDVDALLASYGGDFFDNALLLVVPVGGESASIRYEFSVAFTSLNGLSVVINSLSPVDAYGNPAPMRLMQGYWDVVIAFPRGIVGEGSQLHVSYQSGTYVVDGVFTPPNPTPTELPDRGYPAFPFTANVVESSGLYYSHTKPQFITSATDFAAYKDAYFANLENAMAWQLETLHAKFDALTTVYDDAFFAANVLVVGRAKGTASYTLNVKSATKTADGLWIDAELRAPVNENGEPEPIPALAGTWDVFVTLQRGTVKGNEAIIFNVEYVNVPFTTPTPTATPTPQGDISYGRMMWDKKYIPTEYEGKIVDNNEDFGLMTEGWLAGIKCTYDNFDTHVAVGFNLTTAYEKSNVKVNGVYVRGDKIVVDVDSVGSGCVLGTGVLLVFIKKADLGNRTVVLDAHYSGFGFVPPTATPRPVTAKLVSYTYNGEPTNGYEKFDQIGLQDVFVRGMVPSHVTLEFSDDSTAPLKNCISNGLVTFDDLTAVFGDSIILSPPTMLPPVTSCPPDIFPSFAPTAVPVPVTPTAAPTSAPAKLIGFDYAGDMYIDGFTTFDQDDLYVYQLSSYYEPWLTLLFSDGTTAKIGNCLTSGRVTLDELRTVFAGSLYIWDKDSPYV